MRRDQLSTLAAAIDGDVRARQAIGPLGASFAVWQDDAHERLLIQSLPQCLAWLDALDAPDQADIRTVIRHITRGQLLDVERFGEAGAPRALASAAELDEYTYLVAGCVGEFWTDLCFRHLPDFATLAQPRMRELGRAYGCGLQLINILRDVQADLAMGRCYLPADALAAAGLEPQDITRQPVPLAPLYEHWLARAGSHLDDGMRYCAAVNHRRVRAGSALPALIGARTLALLQQAGAGALQTRVKVPRAEVRSILLRLALTLAARGPIQAQFLRLRS